MIVVVEVGVDAIRRDTPRVLVDTRRPAAVIDVRNMNITSWVDAPNVNCEKPANVPAVADPAHRHHDAGRVRVAGRGGGPCLVPGAGALRNGRAGRGRDGGDAGDRRVDRRPQALRERLVRAQVLDLRRAGARERCPEPGRDHQPRLELAVLDA